MLLHRTKIIMNKMNNVTKDTKAGDTSAGMIIIVVEDIQVELNSLEFGTTYHDDQSSSSHATMEVTGMKTVCTKIGPI